MRYLTESEAWLEIARRLDRMPLGSVFYHLCNRVDDLQAERWISPQTHWAMRNRIDAHMDGQFSCSWDATFPGEWKEPNAFDICRERRILACLFLSLEAADDDTASISEAA